MLHTDDEKKLETPESDAATSSAVSADIEALKNELATAKERAGYLSADFENFRKRAEKERLQGAAQAQATVLADVVSIVDDFERAFAHLEQKPEGTPDWSSKVVTSFESPTSDYFSGFELIYKAFQKMLARYGVTEMAAQGEFNPEIHEAVMHVDDPQVPSGHIVAVLQKGYLLKGALLRPAKVSVKP